MATTLVPPVIVLSIIEGPGGSHPWPVVAAGQPDGSEGPHDGPRVMLADDDTGFRGMLRDLLADLGFDVVAEAGDGAEAVEMAPRVNPDLVLMDLRMPQVDGIEATRLVKSALPFAQVIILSAYDDPGLQRGAEKAGVYCYLIKGCPPQMIQEVLSFAWQYKQGLERGERAGGPMGTAHWSGVTAPDPTSSTWPEDER